MACNIAVAVENERILEQILVASTGLAEVALVERDLADLSRFLERIGRVSPALVILESIPGHPPVSAIQSSKGCCPDAKVLITGSGADPEEILEAVRAGADDYVCAPLGESLRHAIQRALRAQSPGGRRARVLGFFAAKGGCGTTSVACTVAAALARDGRRVLLLDLDLASGVAGFLMKVTSPYSVADAVRNVRRLDDSFWKGLVSQAAAGLDVLAAPLQPSAAHGIEADQALAVLEFAVARYDYAVLDCGAGLTNLNVRILPQCRHACLVTTLELTAFHRARQIAAFLRDSGCTPDTYRVVLNRAPKRLPMSLAECEAAIGWPIDATLPEAPEAVQMLIAERKMLDPRQPLGAQIDQLAARLAGLPAESSRRGPRLFPFAPLISPDPAR